MCFHRGSICKVNCGGYSSGVTPLPIPNRAVKPVCADGSALPGVRVGCCRALRYRMILINIFRYLSFYPRSTSWPTPVGCRGPYSPDPLRRFAPRFLVGILFCIILGSLRVPPRERSANSPVGFCSEQSPAGGMIMFYLN